MVIDQDTSSSLYHHQADTMAAALCRWLCRFAFFLFSQKKRETKKKQKKQKEEQHQNANGDLSDDEL